MIIVNKWFGRLGNNIISLCNIMNIALHYKHNIIFKVHHKLLNLSIIEDYFSKYNNDEILTDEKNFFHRKKIFYLQDIPPYKEIINTILEKSFLIKDIPKLDINDVVIHIRGGDIFTTGIHPLYIPLPLSYYIKQINKHKYRKIIIVSEDILNPVVNKLLELYDNSCHSINSLEDDIKIILGATHLIYGCGTFCPALLIMSNNIKYSYGRMWTHQIKELEEYHLIMKPWRNTKEQIDCIINYKY